MKAAVCTKFGSPDVIQLREIEKPIPKANEILIKVKAVSLNQYDLHYITGTPYMIHFMGAGLVNPIHKILGADIAGRIEAVGSNVKQFKANDEVFGDGSFGGFAEYVCADENRFILKPSSLTFEDAAAVPMAALTALQGLRDKGKIQKGQKVLINGASGGVGSFAVQIAKIYETEVTAVCRNAKMDFVHSLGADHVIDYNQVDITRMGQSYDLILDTAAYRSVKDYKRILKPGGIYALAGGSMRRLFQTMILNMTGAKNMGVFLAQTNRDDLLLLKAFLEEGKLKPAIDKIFPLNEVVDALWYLQDRHVKGKIVVRIE
jgi:NADPH:quinone reductase-like Zn-dependent oxidoreductase